MLPSVEVENAETASKLPLKVPPVERVVPASPKAMRDKTRPMELDEHRDAVRRSVERDLDRIGRGGNGVDRAAGGNRGQGQRRVGVGGVNADGAAFGLAFRTDETL